MKSPEPAADPEGGEALEHVAQSSCGCPIPESVQGHVA